MIRHKILIILILAFKLQVNAQFEFIEFRENLLLSNKLSTQTMQDSYNKVKFIGTKNNLYELGNLYIIEPYNYIYNDLNPSEYSFNEKMDAVDLEILIDTSNAIPLEYFGNYSIEPIINRMILDCDCIPDSLKERISMAYRMTMENYIEGIPVYLYNSSNKNAILNTQGMTAFMLQEAKDTNGVWRPIEYQSYGFCGNGYWDYILKPNYYFVMIVPKYYGNYNTELRIKLRNNGKIYYSDTFNGSINLKQFNIPEEIKQKDNIFNWDFLNK